MGILTIRPATRYGSKVVIGIAGTSGSGKTFTALKLARGMVSSPNEIGLLDAENKRGSLYADILDGQFLIGDLFAPFSPNRYRTAIGEFQDAGIKVLIIDSGSHEWEGDGGCEEIAATGQKIANWKLAKSEHKKYVSALLQSDMHIIVCLRAREKTSFANPKEPQSLGMQPICEKNFMFEMTASMMMWNEGKNQQFLKMPEALRSIFGDGSDYLSEAHGKALVDWVNTGEKVDKFVESWRSKLNMAANDGVAALDVCAKTIPAALKSKPEMKTIYHQAKASALEFDAMKKLSSEGAEAAIVPVTQENAFNPAKLAERTAPEMPAENKTPAADAQPITNF